MRLTVDGRPVDVEAGASVLTAVHTAGASVPTLCWDERLSPGGVCRVCLVTIDGRGVATSCTTPAEEGMVVRSADPLARSAARGVLELLVSALPPRAFDIPEDRSELVGVCRQLGVSRDAFGGPVQPGGRDDTHPYVRLDRDLCITCGRCVRMCDEVQGTFALTLVGRGCGTVVAPGPGSWLDSDCVACGGCVDSCPTGALSEPERSDPRPLGPATTTTCGYCGVGCTLLVHTRDDAVSVVAPALDGPVNHGHACVKGRFAHAYLRSPDRLTTPLIRRDGRLVEVSWDDALAVVGRELNRISAAHGPDAIAAISSARSTNEDNYLMQKLMRTVVGTNNVDNCSRICHAPSAVGLTATFGLAGGTNPVDDIDRVDCILLAGANPTEAHPVVGARIKQRVLRGASLIVIDPRRTELASYAGVHLRGRPGSNVAVFHGLARLLLDGGFVDVGFLRDRATGLDELRARVADYPPERVAQLSGVPADHLRRAARLYGEARRPTIIYGLGVTEHAHGTDGVRTLANLAILRGAVGTDSGGGVNPLRGQNNVQGASDMGALPDLLPGYQKVADPDARHRAESVWESPVPPSPGLRIPEMFDAAIAGRLKALYVFGEDILQTDPDSAHVRTALDACELVISQEIFLSRTAQYADVVLAGAAFLEKDGTFVNLDRRFQRVRPALPPPGLARTDFEILHGVAHALGGDLGCPTPAAAMDECARIAPLFAGVSHQRLDTAGALHWPCRSEADPGDAALYGERFATPDGRAHLAAPNYLPPGEQPDLAYPYVLITGRRLEHYNTGTMTRRTPDLVLVSDELLEVSTDDAARLGLADGDRVEVTSRRGTTVLAAHITDRLVPGQVFAAFHFPAAEVNLLTSAATDTATGCPEYKVTAVRLRRAPSGQP